MSAAAIGETAIAGESAVGAAAAEAASYRWAPVAERAAFAARDGAGALVFKSRMWLLGGWNPKHFPRKCSSEVWSSADGKEWKLDVREAPWEPRHTAGYVVHRGRMWIVGGDAIQNHYQNDVWSTADGVQWERMTDAVPWGPRVLHYTVAYGGKIWVMGGQTMPQFAPAEEIFYSDVWNSEDGVSWTQVADQAPWGPRGMIGGSAVHRGRIWILGGGIYDTPKRPRRAFYNDVWSSADGSRWERHLQNAPWRPRHYHDVAVFDGRLWVMEGYLEGGPHGGNLNDVWHSPDGVNWTELPGTPWAQRHAASVFVHDDALWIAAGNNMFPDVWKLTRQ